MAAVEKLSVALTPEMSAMIRKAVRGGEYASTSEVIREALREWKARRTLLRSEAAELRAVWQKGVDSGPGEILSADDVKAEGRRRMKQTATRR